MVRFIVLAILLCASSVGAQESASFKLTEHVINAGGRPEQGATATSPRFKITLDSIGDNATGTSAASPSFRADVGFVSAYPPSGEVAGLGFLNKETIEWSPEKSTGVYQLYRNLLSNLPDLNFGNCEQQDLVGETTSDTDPVPVNTGYFYIVTAKNRLNEEGTKGFQSNGTERAGTICP